MCKNAYISEFHRGANCLHTTFAGENIKAKCLHQQKYLHGQN